MLFSRPLPSSGSGDGKVARAEDFRQLLRSLWAVAAIALLIAGLGLQQPVPAAVGMLVLLTGAGAMTWSRLSLERVVYERTWPQRRAFVGEEIEGRFSLRNRKALPTPWFEVREILPDQLPPAGAKTLPAAWEGAFFYTHTTSLGPYERVRWRQAFRCTARGYFRVGPTRLRSGDLFGLFPREKFMDDTDTLSVLPRLVDLGDTPLPFLRPFGSAKGGSPLFEDQSRMAGVRDYRPGDPLKRIDWKATARRGGLQSRLFDPSATASLVIALNADTFSHSWEGYDPLLLERAVSVAASLAALADERGLAAGLMVNCSQPGADRPIMVPAGRDPAQLTRVLEALAMVGPFTIATLDEQIDRQARRLPLGASVAVVAAYVTPALATRLERLAREGTAVALYWVGSLEPAARPVGVPFYDLTPRLRAFERSDELAYGGATPDLARRFG
jgi:uncharacterized protein (DUF58 family)